MNLESLLRIGDTAEEVLRVTDAHTAHNVGSGLATVLATPILVNLFEAASLALIEHHLPEGTQSLGTRLDISHTAATPIGMQVRARATLVAIEGRLVTLDLVAHDEVEQIGAGRHERVVVDQTRFDARVERKRTMTAASST